MKLRNLGLSLSAALVLFAAAADAAQPTFYRMVVPNAPGSAADITARALSEPMGKALGKPVVVENLPGAGGIKGTQEIVRGPKDGFTFGLVSHNHAINPSIYKEMPYDSLKDITPISIVADSPLVLTVATSSPAKSVKELIAMAKAKPDSVTYGSAGNGSVLHLAGAYFAAEAGVKLTHVPYKGGSQLVGDLMAGHVNMGFMGIASILQQVKAGKLRALAVTTTKRSSLLPDVPTLKESGLTDYEFEPWIAVIAPPQLPPAVVKQLNAAVKSALEAKEVHEAPIAQGFDLMGTTPEAALKTMQADIAKCAKLVKESGAKIE